MAKLLDCLLIWVHQEILCHPILLENTINLNCKASAYGLLTFEGTPMTYNNEQVNKETAQVKLQLGQHWEQLKLDIIEIPGSNIVLGILWLQEKNPLIYWEEDQIVFFGERGSSKLFPVLAPSAKHLKIEAMSMSKMKKIVATEDVYMAWSKKMKPDFTTSFHFPKQYKEFKKLFEKESSTTALPSHQPWNNKIKLEEGKQLIKHSIYPLLEFKLKILRSYLDKNL